MLSTRPPLVLCAGNKLSSGSDEARNCKLSGEAQWRDKGLVFAGNVHEDESDMAQSHARMGVMIPPLLWRVMFNPFCLCIHLQIFLSPLICINTLRTLFNTDLSDSLFPLVLTAISLLPLRWRIALNALLMLKPLPGELVGFSLVCGTTKKKSTSACVCNLESYISSSFPLSTRGKGTDTFSRKIPSFYIKHHACSCRAHTHTHAPPACTACIADVVLV